MIYVESTPSSGVVYLCEAHKPLYFDMGGEVLVDDSTKSACMMLALVGALAAYILAGGISTAVKWAVGIAKWGWFIVPHFPIDLMFGLVAGAAGLMAFLFFPVIIVGKRYMERAKQLA